MDKHYFIKLLRKYLNGHSTKEEQQYVEKYYSLFQNEPGIRDILGIEETNELKKDLQNKVWSNISLKEQPVKKIKTLNNNYLRAAAAILVLLFISSLFFLKSGTPEKQVAVTPTAPAPEHKQNRIIFLPDGSSVILSPGSKLNYPSSFDDMLKREVYLEGQAFFDIKHNASRPFIVHTGKIETRVLGTAFNIKAIPGESEITVTVKRGKVKVSDQDKTLGIIVPDQQIVYNKVKVKSDVKVVPDENYLVWKEEDLLVDNLTIAEAARLLEDKYKVTIKIAEPSIGSQRFTASFAKNESFEHALKSICLFNEVTYKYDSTDSTAIIFNR